MSVSVTANENGRKIFRIPVTWSVFDTVQVQANSLAEAFEYVQTNLDDIPIDYDDADYVDGSYEITEQNITGCAFYQHEPLVCMDFVRLNPDELPAAAETIAVATYLFGNKKIDVRLNAPYGKVNALNMSIHETSCTCDPLLVKEYRCKDITKVTSEKILADMEDFVSNYLHLLNVSEKNGGSD